ncbi:MULTISPECIES: hypothetical protein [Sphingomonas]|jgi:hypothetical protein|uniref:Endonuclease n=1 Tax=Sphingomonas turrisvirgatae TaxID=1888892 RepID=A0A1E3LYI8_9SPHN|nr:hypothetical protein [Sphingomonas turrisvirgatae]ODP38902.1 hypothetical protein BFL28_12625 [Sphingomonas turrisvirgatae]
MSDELDLDDSAPRRRRASKADAVVASPRAKSLQGHGRNSKVYVPVILKLFQDRWRPGAATVVFSLDDVRTAVEAVRAVSDNPDAISSRNPADVIYRMRSRTKLPEEILAKGFHVLRAVGRGRYQFEKASSGIMEVPVSELVPAIDQTPMPVRRLLPETMAEMDEQALLSVVGYCQLLDHFTGMKIYRLRSHVRKSVPGIGQAELDAIDVGIASGDDDVPVVFPIEAKAVSDELNRVQIFNMIQYAAHYFPGLKVRPLALKVDYQSAVHLMEFNIAERPGDLRIIRSASYAINTSEAQLAMIRATNVPKQ